MSEQERWEQHVETKESMTGSAWPDAAPLPKRPVSWSSTPQTDALNAALRHDDAALTAILESLDPAQLLALANAASRLRRECEAVHNGGQGEPAHHGRTRWEFEA